MKTSLLILAALMTAGRISFAQKVMNDFRGVAWGASMAQVKASENSPLVKSDKEDVLTYKDKLGGMDCSVIYTFNKNNKLINANYIFDQQYSNVQLFVYDYNKFAQLLAEKYGQARLVKEEWSENTKPTDKENFGQAIADGNLTLNTIWDTPRSVIKITLVSIDSKPSMQIHYTYKTLGELEDQNELRTALPKL